MKQDRELVWGWKRRVLLVKGSRQDDGWKEWAWTWDLWWNTVWWARRLTPDSRTGRRCRNLHTVEDLGEGRLWNTVDVHGSHDGVFQWVTFLEMTTQPKITAVEIKEEQQRQWVVLMDVQARLQDQTACDDEDVDVWTCGSELSSVGCGQKRSFQHSPLGAVLCIL